MKLFKRSLALVLSFTTCAVIGAWSQPVKPEAAATSRTYEIFNAQTRLEIPDSEYVLTTFPNQGARHIIDADNRQIDWTKSGVVKLTYNDDLDIPGSGFVVDAHTIATAAHCVVDKESKTPLNIDNILLFDSEGNVELTVEPVTLHVPILYSESTEMGILDDMPYDYALITVEEDLTDYIQFGLGVTLPAAITNNMAVSVTGFPAQTANNSSANTYTTHNMYTGNGNLEANNALFPDLMLCYDADSTSGNSGGPTYISQTYDGQTYYTAIAINTGGAGSSLNRGTRITPELIQFYLNNDYV